MSDLWILAGQSNMEGCGLLEDLEPSHPNVRAFTFGDKWKTAEEPLHWLQQGVDNVHWGNQDEALHKQDIENEIKNRIKGGGLGLPFAKALHAATGVDIDLLPCAHGGTEIRRWNPADVGSTDTSFYAAMIRRTNLALATRPESKIRGVLWYQGESDCNPAAAAVYKQAMIDLIAGLRRDLSTPDLPFYYVQLATLVQQQPHKMDDVATWNLVREIQRTLPSEIPNTEVVPAIDLDLDDGIHISTGAQKRVGKRLANVALRNVYGKPAPTPIRLAGVRVEGNTIVVTYSGVNDTLIVVDKSGRIPGYALSTANLEADDQTIYKQRLTAPNEVTLYPNIALSADTKLSYGTGWNPFCQLVDAADMAAPAFGPVAIG